MSALQRGLTPFSFHQYFAMLSHYRDCGEETGVVVK